MIPDSSLHLRLAVAADFWSALQAAPLFDAPPAPARARHVNETYYDTPGFALARRGAKLGLRKRRGGYEMLAAWPGEETVVPVVENAPDLAALPPVWAETVGEESLAPILTIKSTTLTRTAGPALTAQFCTGTLTTAAAREKFSGLELVQAEGNAAALFEAALALADAAPVRLAEQTPAARGVVLAGGPAPAVARAAGVVAGPLNLDEAMAQIIRACLAQFTANFCSFAQGDAIGAVHQMRVAMRRLRSVLGLFNRALPCPDFFFFREEAKRIASTMGEARNWDVFCALVKTGPMATFPEQKGFSTVLEECETHRQEGHAAVRALLAAPATTRFVLALESFVARRGWRNAASPEGLLRLTEPALAFAAFSLARLHRKVKKRGRHLLRLPPHDRHLLRIEMKKLRYAGELFSGLFASRERANAYNQAATRLQDRLGVLNDLATALQLLARLTQNDPPRARAVGIVMGWSARGATADDSALGASWEAFRRLKPPRD